MVDYKSFHWNLHKKIAHKPFKRFVLNRFQYRYFHSKKLRMFCNPNLRCCHCMERRSSPAFPPLLAFLTRAAPRVPHPNRRPLRRGRLCRPFELSRRVTLKEFWKLLIQQSPKRCRRASPPRPASILEDGAASPVALSDVERSGA